MYKFTVRSTQALTPTTALLTLENASGKAFRFAAGQYVALHFKRHGRRSAVRCFSIVSSPYQPDVLQVALRITGNYSYRLSQLRGGDTVYVQGPFGEFCIDTSYDRGLVFLAGGIGITPIMSMLLYATQAKLGIPIRLLYSCRSAGDIPFAKQLIELEKQNPHLQVTFLIGEGRPTWADGARIVKGRIDESIVEQLGAPSNSTFFVCGPPKFIDGMSSIVTASGVSENRLVIEAFGQRGMGKRNQAAANFRWLYATTAASVLFGTSLLAGHNILESHEVSAQSLSKSAPTNTTNDNTSSTQSTTNNSTTPAPQPSSTSTSPSSTTSTPTSTTTPTATYTQTYQQPVSSVS